MSRELNKKQIAKLYTWVNAPTNLEDLSGILDSLSISDLIFCSLSDDKTAARIAWVEFARQRGIMDMHLTSVEVEGVLELDYEGAAFPVSNQVILGVA